MAIDSHWFVVLSLSRVLSAVQKHYSFDYVGQLLCLVDGEGFKGVDKEQEVTLQRGDSGGSCPMFGMGYLHRLPFNLTLGDVAG